MLDGLRGPWLRATVSLGAACACALFLAVIGAPLWLGGCIGLLAGLRVAAARWLRPGLRPGLR
jgi:hypothetical protein